MPHPDRLLRIAVPALTALCLVATAGWSLLALDIRDLRQQVADLESQRARLLIQHEQHEALTGGSHSVADFIHRTGRSILPADRVDDLAAALRVELADARATDIAVNVTPGGTGYLTFPTITVACIAGSPEVLRILRGIEGRAELIRPISVLIAAVDGRAPLARVEITLQVVTLTDGVAGPLAAGVQP